MQQYLVLIVILIAIFFLGLWGQYEVAPDSFMASPADALYQVLMLFALEGDWTAALAPLPWQLEVTRFLAPLASIAGVLFVLTRGAWIEAINYFIRYQKEHVIVVGLGNKAWQFIQTCHPHYNVVVVELRSDNRLIERARKLGVSVIVGDILSESMWERVSLNRARHLVALTGDDGTNVELAIKARSYLRQQAEQPDQQLRIHLHISDTLSKRLEGYPKFFSDASFAEINFFSVYDLIARIILEQYPPEIFADVFGQKQVHLVLYSFSRLAEHILLEAIRICHFANGSKIRFTILDEHAAEREEYLNNAFPRIGDLCDIEFIQSNVPLQSPRAVSELPISLMESVTAHIICFPSDSDSLELALILRDTLLRQKNSNAPILVRMQQSSGLAQLLESNQGQPEIPDGLYPFGMFDEALHYENILSDGLDRLARVVHIDYLSRRGELDVDRRLYSSLSEWHSLPEPERKSNRLQADHLQMKLRAIRCSTTDVPNPEFSFTDEEAELLAKMEHERWRSNKLFEGWQGGLDRIEGAKVNPYITDWREISADERQSQIETIKRYPEILAKHLGWGIKREFVVGITGHRLNKLETDNPALIRKVAEVLSELVAKYADRRIVLMSPLAEGADRLVARLAMDEFNIPLRVPLPLPYELYQTDFATEASQEEFREMVGRAEYYFELPMRFGSREDLAARIDGASNELRNQQYALVGAYLVKVCDELISIYDEQPEAGTGGTGQVVRWRQQGEVDAVFSNHSDFFQYPDARPPIIIPPG